MQRPNQCPQFPNKDWGRIRFSGRSHCENQTASNLNWGDGFVTEGINTWYSLRDFYKTSCNLTNKYIYAKHHHITYMKNKSINIKHHAAVVAHKTNTEIQIEKLYLLFLRSSYSLAPIQFYSKSLRSWFFDK